MDGMRQPERRGLHPHTCASGSPSSDRRAPNVLWKANIRFPTALIVHHRVTMRRIDQTELEAMLYQALKAAPPTTKTAMRSKLAMESDRAHEAMAKHIAARLAGGSTAVVVADPVDNGYFDKRPGVWGKDEPGPD
ncbi:hypothetical protein [Blastomonas fulva]|jgi:hypothetical protein|nr:hypothetical protein [Blastomonas fulva]